jgi:carbon-monoxide dehydrogenase medium subunit
VFITPFTHHRPAGLHAVFDILAKHGDDAAVYAGGTELLLALKARVLRYEHLIDLKRVKELGGVRVENDFIGIGALATHYRIANDPVVLASIPEYASLSDGIANIRVRVAGTLAGNLSFAEPHSDPPALLAAMGATVQLVSADSERSVPVSEFIAGEFTTMREDNELISEVRVPVTQPNEAFRFRSFGHLERPAVNVAVGCKNDDGKTAFRIWLGAIGDHPIHAEKVETALRGVPRASLRDVLPAATEEFTSGLSATSDLHGSADYKRHLASVLMQRAVNEAAESASSKES